METSKDPKVKLTPEQKRQMTLTARNLKAKRELKERNREMKAHKEVTEQKMKSVADYQESPKNWEKIDRQIQEHFEAHNQTPKQKLTKQRFMEMVSQLAEETGKTELETARELNHYLNQKLDQNQKQAMSENS